MRSRSVPIALFLLAAASPDAWAIKEWYDYYLEARDIEIPAKRYEEAMRNLREAERLKPAPGLNERTYGLDFVDYLPYYYQGVCYLRLGDFNAAIRYFNLEDEKGAVRRSEVLFGELRKLRSQAQELESQRIARLAREEVDRLIREGGDLFKARKFDDALTRLALAQAGAVGLDLERQRQIRELTDRIKAERRDILEAEARAKRIEEALSEGRRLLDEAKATEAMVRFDEVLVLDGRNGRALDGKKEAEQRILASTSRLSREASLREGRLLYESGRFEEALTPLTSAALDPAGTEARTLLDKTRQVVEGMRVQKELHRKIDGLMAEGERLLLKAHKYPEAQVAFDGVLQLDPLNPRAKERLAQAERLTGAGLLDKWLPKQTPLLNLIEPRLAEILGPTVTFIGVATDYRGIASIEFLSGDRPLAQITPATSLETGELPRSVPFEKTFPLTPGANEFFVKATDAMGLTEAKTFRIQRRLRFFETPLFLPSALLASLGLVGLGAAAQRIRRRRAVRNRFNPYIAGAPVLSDAMFFGRHKLMSRILNVLHHNSLMITGERRIGKTTFLFHLKKALESDEGTEYTFFPVLTDLQGVPEAGFFHAVMEDVTDGLRLSPATLASLRFRGEDESYDGRDFSHDLQRVIEELSTRTPKRVKLALLIDEVDVLNEYSERINQRLRSIFMKTFSEHLVAIMSGVGIKRTWKSEGSPWYNFFDEVEITAFAREEAEDLIRTPVAGFFRYDGEAVDAILRYSELKPYVIQKFCIRSVSRILEEGRTTITLEDVEAVRVSVVEEERPGGPRPRSADQPLSLVK